VSPAHANDFLLEKYYRIPNYYVQFCFINVSSIINTCAMLEFASEADLDDDALCKLLSHPFSSVPPISLSQSPKLFFLIVGVLS